MKNNAQELKETLLSFIHDLRKGSGEHSRNSDRDFVRNRKLPFDKMIISILGMEGNSLTNELLRQYGCSANIAWSAAFVQQRAKYSLLHLKIYFIHLPKEQRLIHCLSDMKGHLSNENRALTDMVD